MLFCTELNQRRAMFLLSLGNKSYQNIEGHNDSVILFDHFIYFICLCAVEVWYTQNILSGCSERELWETWDLQNDTKIDTNTKLLAIFKELYYITTCFMQRIAGSMKYTQRKFLKN